MLKRFGFIFLLFFVESSFAISLDNEIKKLSIGIQGGYATYRMKEVNNYIDGYFNYYIFVLSSGEYRPFSMDQIDYGFTFSGDIRYKILSNNNFYLMLNIDYLSAQTESTSILGFDDPTNVTAEIKIRSVPILFSILYDYPLGKTNLAFGGGIGYYKGKIEPRLDHDVKKEFNIKKNWEGEQLGYHIQSEIKYPAASHFYINLNLVYRIAQINKLEDENDRVEVISTRNGDSKILKLDFSGLKIGLGIIYSF